MAYRHSVLDLTSEENRKEVFPDLRYSRPTTRELLLGRGHEKLALPQLSIVSSEIEIESKKSNDLTLQSGECLIIDESISENKEVHCLGVVQIQSSRYLYFQEVLIPIINKPSVESLSPTPEEIPTPIYDKKHDDSLSMDEAEPQDGSRLFDDLVIEMIKHPDCPEVFRQMLTMSRVIEPLSSGSRTPGDEEAYTFNNESPDIDSRTPVKLSPTPALFNEAATPEVKDKTSELQINQPASPTSTSPLRASENLVDSHSPTAVVSPLSDIRIEETRILGEDVVPTTPDLKDANQGQSELKLILNEALGLTPSLPSTPYISEKPSPSRPNDGDAIEPLSPSQKQLRMNFMAMTALIRFQRKTKRRYKNQTDKLIQDLGL